ncbi:MAG: tRNA (N(6)-L-threonylcarbamoyladenosine(37)-C(2))-methylthiotransferase MtaB [Nitrospinae bacterium RIFCSPLOWO2_02_39_17]|nr:MAG: tRNA (N(6)-L-threonylcarbamoyladenosine(37)-C(2))-methylthiotransferase MtaB [Nitrospinae bacterium RIFCSPLOWO2_02_39_17]
MKVAFTTIGCRFNQFETAEMEDLFMEKDFEIVPFSDNANIYIINTCTVTNRSDYRCRQTIRRAIQTNKDAFIVVTGCYSQINPEEIGSIKGVDMILGNMEKLNIVNYLEEFNAFRNGKKEIKKLDNTKIVVGDMNSSREFKSRKISNFSGRTSAYLKIQTGCDQTCSFCIVTIARGPSISEKPEVILNQAQELSDSGFKEIVLTGVNLGSYGDNLKPKTGLSDLVEMLTDVKSIERIRLSSINPREVSDRLISLMKKSKKVCRHLHIPLQSGDNEILKSMRRDYSSGFYKDLIMKLKSNIPDIGIGADVIVGFPGEDEEKFKNTYRLIEELPLSYLHVFTYSQREGTDAFGYEGQITESVKKERGSLVKKLGEHKSNIFKEGFIGKICNVLIENTRDRETGLLKGYTDNYIPIMLKGGNGLMNKIVSVRTTNTSGDAVIG